MRIGPLSLEPQDVEVTAKVGLLRGLGLPTHGAPSRLLAQLPGHTCHGPLPFSSPSLLITPHTYLHNPPAQRPSCLTTGWLKTCCPSALSPSTTCNPPTLTHGMLVQAQLPDYWLTRDVTQNEVLVLRPAPGAAPLLLYTRDAWRCG